MKYINYLYMAASVLAVVACNNEQMPKKSEGGLPINIVTNAEDFSRATQSTVIAAGEKVYVFADNSDGSEYFKAWELNSDGAGNLTSTETKTYPTSGTLDFYGIHGNFASGEMASDLAFPTSAITHTVETDQTKTGNYCVSDLLYSVNKGVASSTNPLSISFYHLLSKVEVALIPGDGFTTNDLKGATVKILNTVNTVNFTPSKDVDIKVQANRAGMLNVDGTATEGITMPVVIKESKEVTEYGEAMVVPQSVSEKILIEITLSNGNKYNVTTAPSFALESGKKYIYDLTIASHGLTVESSVTDWTSESISGNATKYIGNVMPENAQIGDYYMNDGSLVSSTATLTDIQKAACIGIVFQTDVNRISAGAQAALKAKGVTPHGLVMALKNAKQDGEKNCAWSNDENNLVMNNQPLSLSGYYADINGYEKTYIVWEREDFNVSTFEAFHYMSRFGVENNITESEAAPNNTTGWFMPSMGQWWDIITNLGKADLSSYQQGTSGYADIADIHTSVMENINNILDKIGDGEYDAIVSDIHYLTSSERAKNTVCRISFNGKLSISATQKTSKGLARPVLAF